MARSGRSLLPWSARLRGGDSPAVRPLTSADVPALRLPWDSRFTPKRLAAHLARHPDLGWVNPESGEYIVAEPWRHRQEITSLLEVHARSGRGTLLTRAADDLRAAGARLLLLPDGEGLTAPRLYAGHGFARLERIVHYQLLAGPQAVTRPLPPLEFSPLTLHHLPTLLALDHTSFPWLWWNSEDEIVSYAGLDGVQIWLGWAAGVPVAYAGTTTIDRWGHLDRIAVDPAYHGRGYGAAMLAFVLNHLSAAGVNRVTLSTQSDNLQSQRLYQGFGFRLTSEVSDIYGEWLVGGNT
ncbi:MAG: GNAT family N-acetyltransferase [Chloroflexia bacterium]